MGDKRLTVKTDNGYALPLHFEGETTKHLEKIINAYGEIEDIEEEIGIDLKVILRAQKEGIKVKTKRGVQHYKNYELFFNFDTGTIVRFFVSCYQDRSGDYNEYNEWEEIADIDNYGDLWVLESEDFK